MIDDPNIPDELLEKNSYANEKERADKKSKKQFWVLFFLLVVLLPVIELLINYK